jgi:hypothetical protein
VLDLFVGLADVGGEKVAADEDVKCRDEEKSESFGRLIRAGISMAGVLDYDKFVLS